MVIGELEHIGFLSLADSSCILHSLLSCEISDGF